jgi:hypothetical protein
MRPLLQTVRSSATSEMSNATTATSSVTTNPIAGPREATKKVSAPPGDPITLTAPTPVATKMTAIIEAAMDRTPIAKAITITIKGVAGPES